MESEGSRGDAQALAPAARVQSLEESVAALVDENTALEDNLAALRQHVVALEDRIEELEAKAAKVDATLSDLEQWSKGLPEKEQLSLSDEAVLELTVRLAEERSGIAKVHYVDHPGRKNRTVLVTPLDFVDGKTAAHRLSARLRRKRCRPRHQMYAPLHERANTHGFALLLPNGIRDGAGNRFWNPTDECCDGGKSGEDDIAYLTELIAGARKLKDFGPVYLFGYSNGGFMAYHLACKGLPGLRAVASLAGTSYVDDVLKLRHLSMARHPSPSCISTARRIDSDPLRRRPK